MRKLLTAINRTVGRSSAYAVTALLFTFIHNIDGQQIINAGPNQNLSTCGASTTLNATFTQTQPTTAYTYSPIAYNPDPYNQGTLVPLIDEEITQIPIDIGFSFCYQGTTYNSIYICSNNWVGFSPNQTPTWLTVSVPDASGAAPQNAILAPWQDINPVLGGEVRYAVYGTAPFRRFVVSYLNIPMYICTGDLYTSQIKIYETTNIIETHIANKPLCTNWNGGNAVHGLINADGTQATVVAGRNNTQWTTSNEGMCFKPSTGNAALTNYTFEWIDENNTVLSTNPSFTVTPLTNTNYIARITYNCPAAVYTDTVRVIIPGSANAGPDVTVCSAQDVQIGLPALPNATYAWWSTINSNVNYAEPQPMANISNNGTSNTTVPMVMRVTINNQCYYFDTMNVVVKPAPVAVFNNLNDQCLANNHYSMAANGNYTPMAHYTWSIDDVEQNQYSNSISTSFASPGMHRVALVVADNGCVSTPYKDSTNVFAMPVPYFGSEVITGCAPLNVQFNDSSFANGSIVGYKWDFQDGDGSNQSPVFTFEKEGRYDITLTVTSAEGCTSTLTRENYIWVKPTPVADFAVSNTIVDAIYDPYVAITNLSDAQYYLYSWGDGQTTTSPYASHAYTTPGVYTITQVVKNGYGCKDTTSRTIESRPSQTLFLPTAFTPNNDHMNETFVAKGLEVKNFNINIYNRWGQLVFSSNDMNNGWDGTYQGQMCQSGVFTYKITFDMNEISGELKHKVVDGTVTLLN